MQLAVFFVDRKELITGKMCTIVNDVCILKNVSSQNGNCSKLKLILLLTFYIAFVFLIAMQFTVYFICTYQVLLKNYLHLEIFIHTHTPVMNMKYSQLPELILYLKILEICTFNGL